MTKRSPRKPSKVEAAPLSVVERVYDELKAMAIRYEFRPGDRINEGEISKQLGASRTPVREALNRLNIEGFLRVDPGKGFFCRELDPAEVYDLYELRKSLEVTAIRLSVSRAKDHDIEALLAFLDETGPDPGDRTSLELVELDEQFHEGLMAMSQNVEMLKVLRNINARIRFVRWIDMDRKHRNTTQAEHRAILLHLKSKDEAAAADGLERHISRRMDEITFAIKEGYAQIFFARQYEPRNGQNNVAPSSA